MNTTEQIPLPQEPLDGLEIDSASSVDDFIRELEAKEKDLHITSDLTIEVEESDFEPENLPEFVQQELEVKNERMTVAASPAVREPGLKTRVYELEKEVDALQNKIAGLRAERNETQEKSDRRLKDFENYKYRMDRERRGSFIDQIANLASQMLPVLDNLDRALDSVDKAKREKNAEFQQFYDGIALVNHQVHEVFTEMGVQAITTAGQTFDPNFHEAVGIETRDDLPPNTILEELLRGYRIGNRVIRHSMVKVTAAAASSPGETSTPENITPAEASAPEA